MTKIKIEDLYYCLTSKGSVGLDESSRVVLLTERALDEMRVLIINTNARILSEDSQPTQ